MSTEITAEERQLKGEADRWHRVLMMAACAVADAALAGKEITEEQRANYRHARQQFDSHSERLMTLVLGR